MIEPFELVDAVCQAKPGDQLVFILKTPGIRPEELIDALNQIEARRPDLRHLAGEARGRVLTIRTSQPPREDKSPRA